MFPLSGSPATRLLTWAGIPFEEPAYWELTEHFDTHNVFERYREATPWRRVEAGRSWGAFRRRTYAERHLVVVCLGRRVAAAVGVGEGYLWNEWQRIGPVEAAVIPHPSGRNQVYNDPVMRARAGLTLREAIERSAGE